MNCHFDISRFSLFVNINNWHLFVILKFVIFDIVTSFVTCNIWHFLLQICFTFDIFYFWYFFTFDIFVIFHICHLSTFDIFLWPLKLVTLSFVTCNFWHFSLLSFFHFWYLSTFGSQHLWPLKVVSLDIDTFSFVICKFWHF